MKLIRVGVDLAKSVFQVHGVDRSEKVAWRRKLSRAEWIKAVQQSVPLEAEIGRRRAVVRTTGRASFERSVTP